MLEFDQAHGMDQQKERTTKLYKIKYKDSLDNLKSRKAYDNEGMLKYLNSVSSSHTT